MIGNIIPDFRGVKTYDDMRSKFVASAKEIILNHHLEYGAMQWPITSLELYLKLNQAPSVWLDESTDGDEMQRTSGRWYIRQKRDLVIGALILQRDRKMTISMARLLPCIKSCEENSTEILGQKVIFVALKKFMGSPYIPDL